MSISYGPKIQPTVMVSAANGDTYGDDGRKQFRMFQTLIQPNVKNLTLATPPGSPANGDTYVVATGGTGAWSAHDTHIAYWTTDDPNVPLGKWEFYIPLAGWRVYDNNTGLTWQFGTSWTIIKARVVTVTPSVGVVTVDASQGFVFRVNINAAVTSVLFTNGVAGQEITVEWVQDGTGHAFAGFDSHIKGATTPSLTLSTVSTQRFIYDATLTNWYALAVGVTGM